MMDSLDGSSESGGSNTMATCSVFESSGVMMKQAILDQPLCFKREFKRALCSFNDI